MSRIALPIASALAMTVAFAAFAADERTAAGTTVRAKSVLGAKVALKGGTSAGTIEDIVLSNEGVVDYLIVSTARGKLVTVPWDAARFDYGKRMATIDISEEQYQKIPTYSSETYPNYYTPEYRNQVYKHYGLTPGRERRLERRIERRP